MKLDIKNIKKFYINIENKKRKKMKDQDFKIINYSEWGLLMEYNFKVVQLKLIAKKYNIKRSGNKKELMYQIINYLRLSFFIIKIQKKWKLHLRKKYNFLKGPALLNRKCVNENDFYSLHSLKDVDYSQFFSYKDEDGFVYGFNLKSILNLVKKQRNNLKNPYNRYKIKSEIINNLKNIIKIGKFLNDKIIINIDFNHGIVNDKKKVELRTINLFSKIDTFGNITNSNWFLELNNYKIIKFLKELFDVWNYRLQIPNDLKREIVPPHGNPFLHINIPHINNSNNNNLTLKSLALNVIDNLINKSNDSNKQSLGAFYVLGSLTLVSKNAADSLPWLYESFSY